MEGGEWEGEGGSEEGSEGETVIACVHVREIRVVSFL